MVMLDHRLQGLSPISIYASVTLLRGELTVQCYPNPGLREADKTKYNGLERDSAVETAEPLGNTAMVCSYLFRSHGSKAHSLPVSWGEA